MPRRAFHFAVCQDSFHMIMLLLLRLRLLLHLRMISVTTLCRNLFSH